MTASRISDEKPDLSPVLGELDEEQAGRLQTELSAADEALTGVVTTLDQRGGDGFHSEGVILEREVSGQALIRVLLEDAKGAVGFGAELRPKNFYANDGNPWQPGRPPMVMDTSGWDVGGEVTVRYKTRVGARPYTIQEPVSSGVTAAGLPQRTPKANLVPGRAGLAGATTQPARARSAAQTQERLAGFQRAVRKARAAAQADDAGEGDEGNDNGQAD